MIKSFISSALRLLASRRLIVRFGGIGEGLSEVEEELEVAGWRLGAWGEPGNWCADCTVVDCDEEMGAGAGAAVADRTKSDATTAERKDVCIFDCVARRCSWQSWASRRAM